MTRYTILILLTLLFLASTPAQAGKPSILIINSYDDEMEWVRHHNNAFRREIGTLANIETFYMDTKRLPTYLHREQADKAMALYKKIQPDVVLLTDDNALKTLGSLIARNGTPVIYLGINENPRRYFDLTVPITGVLERPLFKRSIVFIKDLLLGRLHKCLVLFDDSTTSRATCQNVFKNNMQLKFADTQVNLRLPSTFDQWKRLVLESKDLEYDAIIIGLYHTLVDNEGQHVPEETVLRWTSANSPIPAFAFWDFSIGKGKAIGGLVMAGDPQGTAAATLVKRVLKGERPEGIHPVTAETGRFVFSRSELDRWGIVFPMKFVQPGEELIFVE